MTLSNYVQLGNSDLKVSPLCLGTMTFGEDWGKGSNVKESNEILHQYIERGGNFIDTANVYTSGLSERIIGDYLRLNHVRRQDLVIATKFFGSQYTGEPSSAGTSRKSIIAACDNSLRRLKTDYIDLYWLHCWDKYTPIQETMSVLNDLVAQGKIRHIGFSDTPIAKIVEAQMIAEFRSWAPLIGIQSEFSLLERTPEEDLLPVAQELNMAFVPWAPLKQGILSGRFTREMKGHLPAEIKEFQEAGLTEHAYRIIDELIRISKQIGATPGQVALSWVRQNAGVTSTIIMGMTAQGLNDHISSLDFCLSDEQVRRLNVVADPKAAVAEPTLEKVSPAQSFFAAAGQFCDSLVQPMSSSLPAMA
jgi:aryl-alcohol dehydrogenase-like predicted oxidoreductase